MICGEVVPVGSKHFITEQVFLKLIASPVSPHFLIAKPISFLAKGREDRAQIGFANSAFCGGHRSKPAQVRGGRGQPRHSHPQGEKTPEPQGDRVADPAEQVEGARPAAPWSRRAELPWVSQRSGQSPAAARSGSTSAPLSPWTSTYPSLNQACFMQAHPPGSLLCLWAWNRHIVCVNMDEERRRGCQLLRRKNSHSPADPGGGQPQEEEGDLALLSGGF